MTYNFDLTFPRIPGAGASTGQLKARCASATLPGPQIEPVIVPLHGVEVSYAGRQIWTKTFTATFNEMRDTKVRRAMRLWIEFARNNRQNTGNYKGGSGINGYATDVILELYDDIPTIVQSTKIINVWPTTIDDLQLEGSSSTAAIYNITFAFDKTEDAFLAV